MGFLKLPNELLAFIADYLGYANLNSLCRVNRQLHSILNYHLYQRNIQQHDSDMLQWAAIHGRTSTLNKALQYAADVNTTALIHCPTFPDGFELRCSELLWFPLGRVATTRNNLPRKFSLLERSATPLMIASNAGYTEFVDTLLQHGAGVNVAGDSGVTPLMAAASAGHTTVMEILLARGADAMTKHRGGSMALDLAARQGHAAAVSLLLRFDADRSRIPWDHALSDAALCGHIQVVRAFLDAGADPRAKYDRYGHEMPLIFWAADGDRPDLFSLLLELGEDIECRNDGGETLLIYSARKECLEVCEMLLQHGADVDARDGGGRSSFYWARANVQPMMVHILLEYCAELESDSDYVPVESD